jgi:PAS domain S-box-containing protein
MNSTITIGLVVCTAVILVASAGRCVILAQRSGDRAHWLLLSVALIGAAGATVALSVWQSGSLPHLLGLVSALLFAAAVLILLLKHPGLANTLAGKPGNGMVLPEERLRMFIGAGIEGVCFFREGRILDVNQQLAIMLGYSGSDLYGKDLRDIIVAGSQKPLHIPPQRGHDAAYEARAVRKDRTSFPVEIREQTISLLEGKARVMVLRDITSQKETEKLLRESEESFRELAGSVTDVFFATDREFHITYWNKASEYMTGISSRDATGNILFDLLPQMGGSTAEEAFREILQTREPRSVINEYEIGGNTIVLEIRGYPTRRGLSVFLHNITVQKRAEEALRESEARFRRLADHSPGIIYRLRTQPHITLDYVSPAATILTGYTVDELTGRDTPLAHFILEEDRSAVKEVLGNAAGTGKPVVLRWICRDGRIVWMEHRTSPIYDESGKTVAGEGIAIDITGRIQAETALRASLEEKEALLKEIHHRVKNNLQIVSSLLSLQTEHVAPEKALEALRESQARVRSMAMIHEQLYSSGDLARIDFAQYVRDLAGYIFRSYSSEARGISLHVDVEAIPLGIDRAIPCGIIINELLTNALKHAFPPGSGGSVRVRFSEGPDRGIVLTVEDDGVGIPDDLDPAKSSSLGLELVQTLVEQIKGSLSMESAGGARFTIRFPA